MMKNPLLTLLIANLIAVHVHAGDSDWELEQTPASGVLNGISAANNYFAIAVGENGSIVHFVNGDTGTLMNSGTSNVLYDVYAVSDQLAIATGKDIVLLWNGSDWQPIVSTNNDTNFTGTWITPEKDYLYYQSFGSPFSFICPHELGAVKQGFCMGNFDAMLSMCGAGDDIKMIMQNGDIRHIKKSLAPFNGTDDLLHDEQAFLSFTGVYVPEPDCISGPFKPTNIYAIKSSTELYHFDGSEWNNMGVILPQGQRLNWINGSGNNNIVAAGYKPNGMGGNDGVIWTYDGTNWTEEILPIGTPGLVDVAVNVGLVDSIFLNGFEAANRGFGIADVLGGRVAVGEEGKITKFTYLPPLVADISVSKSLVSQLPVHSGDTLTFQLTIKNNGPSVANSVRIIDTYSNNIEFINDNCNDMNLELGAIHQDFTQSEGMIDTLAKDESLTCNIEFTVTGKTGEEIINSANIVSIQISDPDYQNNRADVRGVIIIPSN